jgi:17beta-estradiol 17-dehydrogenase / very-long-chain 3-oxoacyl-CoA reductase
VKTLAVDFANCSEEDYTRIQHLLAQHTVSILINNVAVSHSMPTPLVEESLDTLQSIIDVNITATVRLTKLCVSRMISERHGLIVNLGSFAGLVPTALLQTYSGSKAFLRSWSEALAAELRPHGVHCTHLNTYFVVSNMSKISRPSLFVPTAKNYVRAALKRLGAAPCVTPYPWHNIMEWTFVNLINHNYLIQKTFGESALVYL